MIGIPNELIYPSLDWLVSGIFDRLGNELLKIEDNVRSGDYSNEEIVDQIKVLRKQFVTECSDLKIE